MTDDTAHVLAGDCTVTVDDPNGARTSRGAVVVLVKPDDTVLVHDATGYRPAAWLTRADAVHCASDADGFRVTATDGDRTLRVESHTRYGIARYPTSPAGAPVGDCPDCDGTLVRDGTTIACVDCGEGYGVPRRATVREESCSCGLPTMRVERGDVFELCIDRNCESLDDAVRERFDREWHCPDCDGDLRILRRGGLIAGCEHYPDCETGFALPDGLVVGECDCGLPLFEVGEGGERVRCLDATCPASQ